MANTITRDEIAEILAAHPFEPLVMHRTANDITTASCLARLTAIGDGNYIGLV